MDDGQFEHLTNGIAPAQKRGLGLIRFSVSDKGRLVLAYFDDECRLQRCFIGQNDNYGKGALLDTLNRTKNVQHLVAAKMDEEGKARFFMSGKSEVLGLTPAKKADVRQQQPLYRD